VNLSGLLDREARQFIFACFFFCFILIYSEDNEMNFPKELKYTESDEWVKVEGNIATIGITDRAQDALSDIVFFEANVSVDDDVEKGDAVATVESVKSAADVNAPVSGKIVEINEDLGDSPETVNSDPYGEAWMVKIELSDASELEDLMDADTYEAK
jgi:glycine cleavage system H protein